MYEVPQEEPDRSYQWIALGALAVLAWQIGWPNGLVLGLFVGLGASGLVRASGWGRVWLGLLGALGALGSAWLWAQAQPMVCAPPAPSPLLCQPAAQREPRAALLSMVVLVLLWQATGAWRRRP